MSESEMEKHTSRHHEAELREDKEDGEDEETPASDPAADDDADS
jgi:hypothetical protein